MQAILINPEDQSIDTVEIHSLDGIKAQIGFDTLESDALGGGRDRLYFDEECFIRGIQHRFRIDRLIPVAGKGIVIGVEEDGQTLCDVAIPIDELRPRIQFL